MSLLGTYHQKFHDDIYKILRKKKNDHKKSLEGSKANKTWKREKATSSLRTVKNH